MPNRRRRRNFGQRRTFEFKAHKHTALIRLANAVKPTPQSITSTYFSKGKGVPRQADVTQGDPVD